MRLHLGIFALLVMFAGVSMPAQAQFSATWDMIKAVDDGELIEARQLILNGANPNARGEDGYPALMMAGEARNLKMMKMLLENGARVDTRSEERKETTLMRRAEVGDAEAVNVLLENGADVNAQDRGGETSLMKATRSRKTRAVRALIEAKADVSKSDYTGHTAMDYAIAARARGVIKLLEQAGATQ